MNIGLKFRDAMSGALGHVVREELDQLVASIVQHWLVGHNVDGSHSNAIGDDPGDPVGTRFLRDDMVWIEVNALEAVDSPTITGTWTFSTLPVLGTLTGYIKGTGGALSAVVAVPASDLSLAGLATEAAPAAGDFLIHERGGVISKLDWASLPGAGGGETNTASNQGVGGVGLYDTKVGVDLQFRNINAASGRVTVALDAGNKEVDIDVDEAALDIANLGGVIDHAQLAAGGGTATKYLRDDMSWQVVSGGSGLTQAEVLNLQTWGAL
jgi:hypothetical protein